MYYIIHNIGTYICVKIYVKLLLVDTFSLIYDSYIKSSLTLLYLMTICIGIYIHTMYCIMYKVKYKRKDRISRSRIWGYVFIFKLQLNSCVESYIRKCYTIHN